MLKQFALGGRISKRCGQDLNLDCLPAEPLPLSTPLLLMERLDNRAGHCVLDTGQHEQGLSFLSLCALVLSTLSFKGRILCAAFCFLINS